MDDRLEALKARVEVAETEPDYDHEIQGWYAEDVPWLVGEVERLRGESAPCGEPGCPHAHHAEGSA